MVRGVNKTVIEINETGNKYFSRVQFFINPEYSSLPQEKLYKKAHEYIENMDSGKSFKRVKPKHSKKRIKFFTAAAVIAAGALTALLIFL